ncbi:tyrosine integrase [Gordonia phage GEazy]|nr:tyrosine integrase [Gordonia phage GEazy]
MSHATQACVLARADLDLYIESFLARWENPNTRDAYRADLVMWLRWCELHDKDPIGDASRPLVEMWMRWLRDERSNSAATINHRVGTLGQFFEIALDDDLVRKNPCRLARRPKVQPNPDQRIALTRPELQRLEAVAAASCPADHALVMLMGYCGLRVSEACSLDVTDCHEIAKAHRCGPAKRAVYTTRQARSGNDSATSHAICRSDASATPSDGRGSPEAVWNLQPGTGPTTVR